MGSILRPTKIAENCFHHLCYVIIIDVILFMRLDAIFLGKKCSIRCDCHP